MKKMEIKNNSSTMQNVSQLGYKTFTSQFSQTTSEQGPFEQRALAIKKNQLQLLDYLCVGNKVAFSQKNQNQLTLLHFAAYYNSPVCALYLLYKNASLGTLDKQGKSVFHICSYTGHLDTMVYMHEFWKINRIRLLNDNFLKILTKIGFKRTDAKLGKLKIQVSKERLNKFNKGRQQITNLYRQYRREYSQFILKIYQLPDVTYIRNCFHYAALNKYQKCLTILEYMIKSLHNQDLVLTHELQMSLNEVSALVPQYCDPRQFQDSLSIVKDFILPEILRAIEKEEAQKTKESMCKILQAKDKDSHTPIYLASKTGSASIVSLLKKIQEKYSFEKTQTQISNDDIIKIALNNTSRGQIIDLCEASKNADVQIINFLISCGQEVNKKKTIFGTFALLQAIKAFQKQKNIEPIRILLKSGADVNEQDSNGWTIFHHIAEKEYSEILLEILKQRSEKRISKLNINKSTNKGYHPLHIAAMNNHTSIIKIMMDGATSKMYQIDTHPLDEQKATILHCAAKKGCLQVIKQIFNINAKRFVQKQHQGNHFDPKQLKQQLAYRKALLGAKDVNDNTCLHLAAANNHTECVKEIIRFDSDQDTLIKLKNKKGKLPKDLTLKKKCFFSIFTAARQGDVNMIRNLNNEEPALKDSATHVMNRTPLILSVISMQLVNVKFLVDLKADQYHEDAEGKSASKHAEQLTAKLMKQDRSKLPLINKIKSLLD